MGRGSRHNGPNALEQGYKIRIKLGEKKERKENRTSPPSSKSDTSSRGGGEKGYTRVKTLKGKTVELALK